MFQRRPNCSCRLRITLRPILWRHSSGTLAACWIASLGTYGPSLLLLVQVLLPLEYSIFSVATLPGSGGGSHRLHPRLTLHEEPFFLSSIVLYVSITISVMTDLCYFGLNICVALSNSSC